MPNSVISIGYRSFYGCGLTSITIPSSVTFIGGEAFYGCGKLIEITNYQTAPPNGISSIFSGFDRSKCTLFVPAEAVVSYLSTDWKQFKVGVIGDVTTIYGLAETLIWTLSEDGVLTVKGVGDMPEHYSGGISGVIPTGPYPSWDLYNTWDTYSKSIKHAIIEEGVSRIGRMAFGHVYVYSDYSNLTFVSISSSVTSIGDVAFNNCVNLTTIINYRETPQTINESIFYGVNKTDCILFVPAGSEDAYRSADGWSDFENIQTITE
jgi:hypothetical protein